MPVFLDMVQDNVRHRLTAALLFMGLLSVIVFTVFNPVFVDPNLEPLFRSSVGKVLCRSLPSRFFSFSFPTGTCMG